MWMISAVETMGRVRDLFRCGRGRPPSDLGVAVGAEVGELRRGAVHGERHRHGADGPDRELHEHVADPRRQQKGHVVRRRDQMALNLWP